MISKSLFLCLFLLACPIYCLDIQDQVTLSVQLLDELTQSQLSTSNGEVLKWGSTQSDIYKCANLSNKYYDTMAYQQTISKQLTGLQQHNNVYVTFDAIFLNIAAGNPIKHGQVDIDGTVKPFQGNVNRNYYSCMARKGTTYYDGYTSVGLLFSHNNPSMTISIKPTDLGTQARLGVANMKVYLANCGWSASFDTSALKCKCNPGYQQLDLTVGVVFQDGSSSSYIERRCVYL